MRRTLPKATATAEPLIPSQPTLKKLRRAAADCRACPLWKTGTQTVFGEGSPRAKVFFVGETPGNEEDLGGRPFVGPAGRLSGGLSAVLRVPDDESRRVAREQFVADMMKVAQVIHTHARMTAAEIK